MRINIGKFYFTPSAFKRETLLTVSKGSAAYSVPIQPFQHIWHVTQRFFAPCCLRRWRSCCCRIQLASEAGHAAPAPCPAFRSSCRPQRLPPPTQCWAPGILSSGPAHAVPHWARAAQSSRPRPSAAVPYIVVSGPAARDALAASLLRLYAQSHSVQHPAHGLCVSICWQRGEQGA